MLYYYDLQRSGALDQTKAQDTAIRLIKRLRYGDDRYFWINDVGPSMVMHPTMPELDGKDLSGYSDPNGVSLFKEFVRITQSKGSGFLSYQWPKPGDKNPVSKISYVMAFEPWGWIIGSGIYLDDVQAEMAELRTVTLGGALAFAFITLLISFWVGTGITRRLGKVINGLKAVATGNGNVDLSKRIAITSIDEIGTLSFEFNSLMDSIGSLTRFKKIIEDDDTLDDVYSRLWHVFSDDLDLQQARIYEVDLLANRMRLAYPLTTNDDENFCSSDILDNSALCKSKRTAHEISSYECEHICKHFIRSDNLYHICVPMTIGNGTLGVVQFIFDKRGNTYDPSTIKERIFKASQFINEALPVIESRRLTMSLRDSALTDPLTNLKNRRFLQECSDNLCKNSLRRGKAIALLMCDLDYFKQVNDIYGHDAGDDVLKQTAVVLCQSVRGSDLVFRLGGEEFLILLIDIDPGDTLKIAEKVRRNIENHKFVLSDGTIIQKTTSIGVGEFPIDSDHFWRVIKFSDIALYNAKDSGRNRVSRFSTEMWKEDQY